MKKMYSTWYDARIEEVEVIRETAKFVTLVDSQRWAKRSDDHYNFFDTWSEARQFLIDREKTAIIRLLAEVKQHQETLEKIEAMRR